MLLILVLLCLILWYVYSTKNDHMTSGEVMSATGGQMNMDFVALKEKLPEVDITQYYGFKNLAQKGLFTSQEIDKLL